MNSLQINVAQLLKEPAGSRRSYTLAQIAGISERDESLPQGEVKLLRTGRGILAEARVKTRMTLVCSRCLKSFEYTPNFKFEEEYYPSINIVTGLPQALPEEPGAFCIDQNHILDLSEAVRQYELMAIPMKPLCRSDCAGICPQCGGNLNQGACGCTPSPDSRWSILRELMSSGKITTR